MTVDLSEFDDSRSREREPCRVADALALLAAGDRKKAEAALADVRTKRTPGKYRAGRVADFFQRRNLAVYPTSVVNHRDKRCRCHA